MPRSILLSSLRQTRSAYHLPADAGRGRTVAVVAAYDNPDAEADLAAYRRHYGLPPCTTANGCFRKVSQRGRTTDPPAADPGWGLEISLDLDAVSATCPSCSILLVEADSSSLIDLIPAVHTAERLGADAISNSYGTRGEFSGEQYLERQYRDIGVPFVVATGDYGYGNGAMLVGGVGYPAASRFAVAVGGTTLTPAVNDRGWSESAWAGATSGCSAYIRKPGRQRDDLCGMRTVADIAALADRRPAWPCTTPSASADGCRWAGPASPRRSSRAGTRWRARRLPRRTRPTCTGTRAGGTT